MPYLIDTDIVIDFLGGHVGTADLLDELIEDRIGISAVTYMEARHGVLVAAKRSGLLPPNLPAARILDDFVARADFHVVDRAVAERAAAVRAEISIRGGRVRTRSLDLITAAVALERGLTLVTRNVADFRDVVGLDLLEDDRVRG